MAGRRHERPVRRVNPSGRVAWVARPTDRDGQRHYIGTFEIKGPCRASVEGRWLGKRWDGCCAQHAIDAFYDRDAPPAGAVTVGDYFAGWLKRRPRSDRTDESYDQRIRYVLDVELDRRKFRDHPMADVQRRHADGLVDVMLRVQGRAVGGVRGVLRVLSVMWQDALVDVPGLPGNPFIGVKVRAKDPRVRKATRKQRVFSWEQMHALCAATALPVAHDPMRVAPELRASMVERWRLVDEWRAVYAEPMTRVLSDCGLRAGELPPLERGDVKLGDGACDEGCELAGPHLHVRRTAWRGRVSEGTKSERLRDVEEIEGREVPLPPALAGMLERLPRRIDTRLLFPTVTGQLFLERNFARDVWDPARARSGVDATRQDFRHSFVSLMRAAGIDPADLAYWTGHTVATATARYTHSTGASVEAARRAVG